MAFDPGTAVAVIAVYFLVTLGVGLLAWRFHTPDTVEEYLLNNRGFRWFVGFFSTAASLFSAVTLIGFVGFFYKFGVASVIGIIGR
ncbi:MAG: hypothetical protein ABEK12_00985, partial [Candidatus Nanohaloarchaea archaeon]